ncbi:LacI family transcriptional regulator [Opitutaceae bacterium TAV5]|nr:LacI family transcriptional regulator [Opitutaceae bacterium TAV5]
MERRITLRDIARETRLHYTTVSLALRGDTRIRPETRTLVEQTAARMGYVPDPMVSALSVYRTAMKPSSFHGTLACLVNDAESHFHPDHHFIHMRQSMIRRAGELGYRIEEFLLRTPGMNEQRMSGILQARGIRGIIVAPQPETRIDARIEIDWSHFTSVAIGYSLAWPQHHLVVNHQFRAAKLAVQKLAALGYRRIGLFVCSMTNHRVDENWLGGYLAEVSAHKTLTPLAPLFFEHHEKRSAADLHAWMKRWRPDAIITDHFFTTDWLIGTGKLRIPDDVGAASLYVPTEKGFHAGVDQNDIEIGAAAIDLLVSLLHTNVRGIPACQRHLLIEGIWREGRSVRIQK